MGRCHERCKTIIASENLCEKIEMTEGISQFSMSFLHSKVETQNNLLSNLLIREICGCECVLAKITLLAYCQLLASKLLKKKKLKFDQQERER